MIDFAIFWKKICSCTRVVVFVTSASIFARNQYRTSLPSLLLTDSKSIFRPIVSILLYPECRYVPLQEKEGLHFLESNTYANAERHVFDKYVFKPSSFYIRLLPFSLPVEDLPWYKPIFIILPSVLDFAEKSLHYLGQLQPRIHEF